MRIDPVTPEAKSLYDLADDIRAVGDSIVSGKFDVSDDLKALRGKISPTFSRLGGGSLSDHAVRNAATAFLLLMQRTAEQIKKQSESLNEIKGIVLFERATHRAVTEWLASQK